MLQSWFKAFSNLQDMRRRWLSYASDAITWSLYEAVRVLTAKSHSLKALSQPKPHSVSTSQTLGGPTKTLPGRLVPGTQAEAAEQFRRAYWGSWFNILGGSWDLVSKVISTTPRPYSFILKAPILGFRLALRVEDGYFCVRPCAFACASLVGLRTC